MKKEIEILAPAGSMDCLKAAIAAGADAVYVGGSMFGARAYANNFTEEELLQAIDHVHLHGRKLFLTVNTLLKEHELEEKCNFETDRIVKLPFDALETANMLINAKYRRKANGIDRFRGCEEDTIETDMYSVGDLEQIAEHLLVYCNHNRECEE